MNIKNNDDSRLYSFGIGQALRSEKPTKSITSMSSHLSAAFSKALLITITCTTSICANAAILNDSSERRIQVRQGSNNSQAYIYSANSSSNDSMQGLIEQKSQQYDFEAQLSIEENKRVITAKRSPAYTPSYNTVYNTQYGNDSRYNTGYNNDYYGNSAKDFDTWLSSNRYRAQQVASYQRYLSSQLGAQNVPPLEQLLTTARSWDRCGYEPFQLPPQELWSNMVPTLRLYSRLKSQGILPASTEIRSVYRSPSLNDCAGGATNSKHMSAGAMDIWVPEYEGDLWQLSRMQDSLCQFWLYQGQAMDFGLGLYSTGAVHLDSQGYRKWGFNHASSSSSCRY